MTEERVDDQGLVNFVFNIHVTNIIDIEKKCN